MRSLSGFFPLLLGLVVTIVWWNMEAGKCSPFVSSLCKEDPLGMIFPGKYRPTNLVRAVGEVKKLTEFLGQSPHDLGAEGEVLKHLESEAQNANFHQDWPSVVFIYEQFLEVVRSKHAENSLSPDALVFLTLFAGIPLTDLYHLKIRNLPAAIKILDGMEEVLKFEFRAVNGKVLSAAVLYPDLLSSLRFRLSLVLLERERESCSSPEEHADSRKETIQRFIEHIIFSDVNHRNDKMQDLWFMDMRVCASLQWLWWFEGQPEAAIYWLQLCRILQKKFKDMFCIKTPQDFKATPFSLDNSEQLFVVEVRTTLKEAMCYAQMGKLRESIAILLKVKDEVSSVTWMEVRGLYLLLLEVNQELHTVYLTTLRGEGDSDELTEQLEQVKEEISQLQEEFDSKDTGNDYLDIKMLKMKAKCLMYEQKRDLKESLANYEKCLQLVKQTNMPRDMYIKHALDCLLHLGVGETTLYKPAEPSGSAHLLRACQHFEEALELAYEAGDISLIVHALAGLGHACLAMFCSSLRHPELPQFSGTWLASSKGPFAGTTWNEYHSVELQTAERLCRLQIAKQAEILYVIKDHHDDWSHATNRWNQSDVYVNLQKACALMITGLVDLQHELQHHGAYSEQVHSDIGNHMRELLVRSLLSSERGRTRTLVYQLGPRYLCPETAHSLMQFDLDDKVAWNAIQDSQLVCGVRSVCVEYCYDVGEGGHDEFGLIYVYVVSRNSQGCRVDYRMIEGGRSVNLKSLLDYLHSAMSNTVDYNETEVTNCLETLYKLLITPIANLLPSHSEQKLIFAPHAVLANVPFGLLRDPSSKQFLFELHTISLAPSLRVLGFCKQRYLFLKSLQLVDDTRPIVLVGDPAYLLEHHRLPGAGREVDSIAAVFRQDCVARLKGSDATVKAVLELAEQPSKRNRTQACIHFAVHGHVTKDYPKGALELSDLPSATPNLVAEGGSISAKYDRGKEKMFVEGITENLGALELSTFPSTSSDGFAAGSTASFSIGSCVEESHRPQLEALQGTMTKETNIFGEVGSASKTRTGGVITVPRNNFLRSEDIIKRGIDWRAYLLVLSACNTSRGQVFVEGVLNLPRAFMVAGVPCVVMSQWRIDDASTSKVMTEFYTNLKEGVDVASALRICMLKMMRSGMEIYKWGPFAVWGLPTVCLPSELSD